MTSYRILAFASVIGCVGNIGGTDREGGHGDPTAPGGPGSGSTTLMCTAADAGTPPVRRLTRVEYNNAVHDLLGDTTGPAKDFAGDGTTGIFSSNKDTPVSSLLAIQYLEAAEKLAKSADLATLLPCATPACARTFIEAFGKRAYRRPLDVVEVDRLFAVYTKHGARTAIATILQSPFFLHHIEPGLTATGEIVPLSQYEVAARLSFLLWKSIPDAELMRAADEERLATADQVEAAARRMLANPRSKQGILAFYRELFDLERLPELDKEPYVYADFGPAVARAMQEETERFIEYVLFEGDRKLDTLLTASFTFANETVAGIYGLTDVTGSAFVRVSLDPAIRGAGILTHPSILALHAHNEQTSPVRRGLFVRERLLCDEIPNPPPAVDVSPPPPSKTKTTRQRLSMHQTEPYCSGCHRFMDPIGLGFEKYDAVGRYRLTENGIDIDDNGEIVMSDLGKFKGVVDLAKKLATSDKVRGCFAKQWFRYALGRNEVEAEACSLQQITERFTASKFDLQELVIAVARSDAFRHRQSISSPISGEVCK